MDDNTLWQHMNRHALLLATFGLILPGLALGLGALNIQSIVFTLFCWIICWFICVRDKTPRIIDAFKAALIIMAIVLIVLNYELILEIL